MVHLAICYQNSFVPPTYIMQVKKVFNVRLEFITAEEVVQVFEGLRLCKPGMFPVDNDENWGGQSYCVFLFQLCKVT